MTVNYWKNYHISRTKKNSRILYKNPHLCQCSTEGESNQQPQQGNR